jgi:BirA family biotin operon repressor/biotin-[acetyl-CoA-carboxylase] ligase
MIITFEEIDSTNSYIERNIQTLPDHTLVRALYQRFGHGRCDHIWDSPKGENLLFSILLKSPKRPFVYTMCAAYAIVLVLRDYHIAASIKFPNDIYVDDQ